MNDRPATAAYDEWRARPPVTTFISPELLAMLDAMRDELLGALAKRDEQWKQAEAEVERLRFAVDELCKDEGYDTSRFLEDSARRWEERHD